MREKYVIECRRLDGTLDFTPPQPESVFGLDAITGITDDAMARVIFRKLPELVGAMHGQNIPQWPSFVDPRWTARTKTW